MLLAGLWQVPLTVMTADLTYVPGTPVDNRLNNYILEHGYRWLTGAERSFWNAPFCWPAQSVTARSDAHLGELPVYVAFRAGGLGPERAFQGCILAFFVLNFLAAHWALRQLGAGPVGASAGSYLFTFGLPVVQSLGHLQLQSRFFIPLACLIGWRVFWGPTWRRLAALAVCLVGQLYMTMYLGLILIGMLAFAGLLATAWNARQLPWGAWLRPGWAEAGRRLAVLAVAGAAALPVLVPHARMAATTPLIERELLVDMIPDPVAWVLPTPGSATWAWAGAHLPLPDPDLFRTEKILFPGLLPNLSLIFGSVLVAVRPCGGLGRSGLFVVAVLVAVSVPLLVVRSEHWSPYESLLGVPLIGTLRAIGRTVFVYLFPLGLVLAFASDTLIARVRSRCGLVAAAVVGTGILALLAVDQRLANSDSPVWDDRRYPVADSIARRQSLAAAMRAAADAPDRKGVPVDAVFVFSPSGKDWDLVTQLDAMWAAQEAGFPTLNGWTGYPPQGWWPFVCCSDMEVWLRKNGKTLALLSPRVLVLGEPRGLESDLNEQEFRRLARCHPLPGGR